MQEWASPFSAEYTDRCRQLGYWQDRTLFDYVQEQSGRTPGKSAVVDGSGRYRYEELVAHTLAVARGLQTLGVHSRTTVLVAVPPIRQFVPLFLGIEALGAVVVNVMPSLGEPQFSTIIRLAQPQVLVTVEAFGRHQPLSSLQQALDQSATARDATVVVCEPRASDVRSCAHRVLSFEDLLQVGRGSTGSLPERPRGTDLCNLTFTTGTTGEPKGVLHTHNTSLAAVQATARCQLLTSDDVFHAVLPVGHTFGYFYGVRLGLAVGGTIVMQSPWDAGAMVRLVERECITHSAGTPTHLMDLVQEAKRTSEASRRSLASLRVFTCAGAPLAPALAREATALLTGRLSSAYGMSEAGHVASTRPESPLDEVAGSVGLPHSDVNVWVDNASGGGAAETGEIVVSGPSVFPGYVQGREFSKVVLEREGTYRTGDIGYLDAQGYLVLTGRKKELVIRGGEKIPVGEVETVLRRFPGVREGVIVGVPDARLGERAVAVVECPDGQDLNLAAVTSYLDREGIYKAYWPEALVTVKELPRNDVGKWIRADIARLAAQRLRISPEPGDDG